MMDKKIYNVLKDAVFSIAWITLLVVILKLLKLVYQQFFILI
ncbi:hypothetical protein [Clostridium botulinum]|nr:hypothetical protein [Clostridium botulinum]